MLGNLDNDLTIINSVGVFIISILILLPLISASPGLTQIKDTYLDRLKDLNTKLSYFRIWCL
ncbi:unnamed protein product [marine sediment metagenome]|uniref:Uncharacterized protein n=1 Tax=marine sediment metagenome TaxID=412755 RepID=X1F8V6_9ZZZZ